jgi:hypothetical protein
LLVFIAMSRVTGLPNWSAGMDSICVIRPPWELRPWVMTEEGRREYLGKALRCVRCDEEQELPGS